MFYIDDIQRFWLNAPGHHISDLGGMLPDSEENNKMDIME